MTERRSNSQLSQPIYRETTLTVVKPHLEILVQGLTQRYPAFLERLKAFLADPNNDPTGWLRLFNLLSYAEYLQRDMQLVVDLLAQIDASRSKTEAQSQKPGEGDFEGWEK